ncbi:hypothetical protein DM02DRAFT_431359 [Periconia macrospinosa]|uniref:Secreted protein n=1 Tax=Periconia macrospinosa TaxID=97972 RepID=A0A2V1CXX2_9PLEO|nr:hypothetical protein DM02DRAFT_431359 [Periconia macrospinosa]
MRSSSVFHLLFILKASPLYARTFSELVTIDYYGSLLLILRPSFASSVARRRHDRCTATSDNLCTPTQPHSQTTNNRVLRHPSILHSRSACLAPHLAVTPEASGARTLLPRRSTPPSSANGSLTSKPRPARLVRPENAPGSSFPRAPEPMRCQPLQSAHTNMNLRLPRRKDSKEQ